MRNDPDKLLRLKKAELLRHKPICEETVSCRRLYDPNITLVQLYTHDVLEITMVLSGSGVHRVLNQAIPCKAGDIYITGPDVPHGFFVQEDFQAMTLRRMYLDLHDWFEGEITEPEHPRYCYGVFSDSAATAYAMLNAQTQYEIASLLDAITRETAERQPDWQDAVQAHLSLLLITVGRYVNRAIKSSTALHSREGRIVTTAIRMVLEHYDDCTITLESIADQLYISKSHLSRLFKRVTGEAFSDYLRSTRLDRACYLLLKTELNIEQIVRQCGLRDVPSFYRIFSAQLHMTPHQYRTSQSAASHFQMDDRFVRQLGEISQKLQQGDAKAVQALVQAALDAGCPPQDILEHGLMPGMQVVGEQFRENIIYVPEVVVVARAMNYGVQVLKPYFAQSHSTPAGRVCIGTVLGDLHDIGKNIVKMMMESRGLEVIDLGVDVAPEEFIRAAIANDCQVICCSALLTTTMEVMEEVVKAAETAGIRDKVKIMIGGAPTSADFCRQIGADCYTVDASSAADAAVAFCKNAAKTQ